MKSKLKKLIEDYEQRIDSLNKECSNIIYGGVWGVKKGYENCLIDVVCDLESIINNEYLKSK